MILNGVMAVTLRYFIEFRKPSVSTHNRVDLWWNLCTSLLYFVLHVRCRGKENSRSLSHLLMSFFFIILYFRKVFGLLVYSNKWRTESGSHMKLAGRFPPLLMQQ